MPRGLYIDRVVATSNTNRAAPALATSWIRSPLRSPLDNVVSATTRGEVANRLQVQQQDDRRRNGDQEFDQHPIMPEQTPFATQSDWRIPVSGEARLNGTMTNQAVNSIAR